MMIIIKDERIGEAGRKDEVERIGQAERTEAGKKDQAERKDDVKYHWLSRGAVGQSLNCKRTEKILGSILTVQVNA